MVDLTDVSTAALNEELERRGRFSMISIWVDDLMQIATDENMNLTRDDIEKGLRWVWNYYDMQPDREAMIDHAIEKAQAMKGTNHAL